MLGTKKRAPEGAHGQRNVDGSYFSVWMCQNGHGNIGEVHKPGQPKCFECSHERFKARIEKREAPAPGPAHWRRATTEEAHDVIFEIEGFRMYDGVGFRMLHNRDGSWTVGASMKGTYRVGPSGEMLQRPEYSPGPSGVVPWTGFAALAVERQAEIMGAVREEIAWLVDNGRLPVEPNGASEREQLERHGHAAWMDVRAITIAQIRVYPNPDFDGMVRLI